MVARTMIIAFLVLLTYLSVTNASNITTDEASLLAFKAHITSDPNGMLSKNWTKRTHICNWIGISCSKKHQRVTSLVLKSFGFRDSIATDIGNLSFLNFLDIGNNSFHGQIPDEIGRLRRLKYLYLQMNNLTGQIPQSLGFLTRLQFLHLSENRLFGNVPLSIFSVSSLKDIDLSRNYELTGSLPNEICTNLPVLEYISLQDNQFVGELPSGLNICTKLEVLSLSYNKFTGNLPRDMWNMSKVQELFIGWNNFIGHLSSLEGLYLGSNALSGEVPVRIFNISSLKVIAVAANTLSGKLPSNLGYSLPNLEGLYLGINNFSGTLPSSISNATKLKFLDLGRNMFSGNVPIDLGINLQQIQSINFQRNMLTNAPSSTGEISFLNSFSHCKYLKFLMIGNNQFNGILPKSSLTNMSLSLERSSPFTVESGGKSQLKLVTGQTCRG
uniref:Serine-threonine protein kinase, plant-type n=1 Tax=Solanum tuberosum TaxID=4113 RepID=M1DJB6_SOLTU